jgi:hypothetical protein
MEKWRTLLPSLGSAPKPLLVWMPARWTASTRRRTRWIADQTGDGNQGDGRKTCPLGLSMLRWGMPYVDRGAELYEEQHRQRQILYLKRKAADLGFKIIETATA